MVCPECGSENTYCKDSRQNKNRRRRRYQCADCNVRFTTVEVYATRLDEARDKILSVAAEIITL